MQPVQQQYTFDQSGNLVISGIHAANGSWSVDKDGSAAFTNLSVPGEMTYQGDTLFTLFSESAGGIQQLVLLSLSATPYDGVNPLLIGRMLVPNWNSQRQYKFGFHGLITTNGTAQAFVTVSAYIAWNVDATPADTLITNAQDNRGTSTNSSVLGIVQPLMVDSHTRDTAHISLYLTSSIAGPSLSGFGNPRMWIEDAGPGIAYGAWSGSGNPAAQYQAVYEAIDSATYDQAGNNLSSVYGTLMAQGAESSTYGNRYSMAAFPYATIQSDLMGVSIFKTEVLVTNQQSYQYFGTLVKIGTHNQTTVAGNHLSSEITTGIDSATLRHSESRWLTDSFSTIGNALKNGTAKGIAYGPGAVPIGNDPHDAVGVFAGSLSIGKPKIRITYSK